MAAPLPEEHAPSPAPAMRIAYPAGLDPFNRSVSAYLAEHYPPNSHDGLATCAMVFDAENRILLLRRAAHDSMPGLWEPPGGAADEPDGSLLVSCARELWEEAGLLATAMVRIASEGDGIAPGNVFGNRTGERVYRKFAFEVAVSGSLDVRLDAHEHDAYVWATEEEIRSGRVPGVEGDLQLTFGATRELIYDGFRRRREEPAETPSRVVERDGAVL
ncbi:hypothetical protein BN1723_013806, partial [Verticillium longisporum]|uniref:Nudix hydrolase domain-containing protein n=2 Tax=Verticillium TaxID=1036719 RepID=A0A0G4MG76_VERLO